MNGGGNIRDLLQAADRSAPRPAVRPVSLSVLQRRLRYRRARAAVLMCLVLACAHLLLRPAHSPVAGSSVEVRALQAEVAQLLRAVAEMRLVEAGPSDDMRLALERSAMASYAYGETLRAHGDPTAAEQLEHVARIWPGTAGGRLAGQRLETVERNER